MSCYSLDGPKLEMLLLFFFSCALGLKQLDWPMLIGQDQKVSFKSVEVTIWVWAGQNSAQLGLSSFIIGCVDWGKKYDILWVKRVNAHRLENFTSLLLFCCDFGFCLILVQFQPSRSYTIDFRDRVILKRFVRVDLDGITFIFMLTISIIRTLQFACSGVGLGLWWSLATIRADDSFAKFWAIYLMHLTTLSLDELHNYMG